MSESGATNQFNPPERLADASEKLVQATEKAAETAAAEAAAHRRDVESAVAYREVLKTLQERAVVAEERKAVAFEAIAKSLAVLAAKGVTNV